jgi:hypothetical protein
MDEKERTPMRKEGDTAHIIGEDQAEAQIGLCEAHLKEEQSRGRPILERLRLLNEAKALLREGHFTQAFLMAIRARGITVEKLP